MNRPWMQSPFQLLRMVRGFFRWVRLLGELSPLPHRGPLTGAQAFLQEQEAWIELMRAVQFSDEGSLQVLDGLARRHGASAAQPDETGLDEVLLVEVTPLIWFFHRQKERFPAQSVPHGCAVGLL